MSGPVVYLTKKIHVTVLTHVVQESPVCSSCFSLNYTSLDTHVSTYRDTISTGAVFSSTYIKNIVHEINF